MSVLTQIRIEEGYIVPAREKPKELHVHFQNGAYQFYEHFKDDKYYITTIHPDERETFLLLKRVCKPKQPKRNPKEWERVVTNPVTQKQTVVSISKRQMVYERDGNKCLACGTAENLTLDHIVPRSLGGNNNLNNLQTLCWDCNNKKDNRIRDYRTIKENSIA